MDAGELARALGGARREGAGWRARCPAHDDHDPSLGISDRDGKLLVHCRAGCSQADIIAALRERQLWSKPNTDNGPRIAAVY